MRLKTKRFPIFQRAIDPAGIVIALAASAIALLSGLPAQAHGPSPAWYMDQINVVERLPDAEPSWRDNRSLASSETITAPEAATLTLPASQELRFERLSTVEGPAFMEVSEILQDSRGLLWFGTQTGLFKYDGYQFKAFKHYPDDPGSLSHDFVESIYEDRTGQLWVGTVQGLDRFDRASGSFIRYQNDPDDPASLSPGSIRAIYQDRTGMLWIGTSAGMLDRFDPASDTFTHYDVFFGGIWKVFEDRDDALWVGTSNGLYLFDRIAENFAPYRHDPNDPTSLSDNNVRAIYEDRQGGLWIGTYGGGLDRFDRTSNTFLHYRHDPANPHSLSDDRVTAILEDREGRLWVGTNGGGLNQLSASNAPGESERREAGDKRFLHYRHSPIDPYSLSDDAVLSIHEDRSGVLWIGTLAGVSKLNPTAAQFTHYQRRLDFPADSPDDSHLAGVAGSSRYVLSDAVVTAIYEDHNGKLWIGTADGGLNRLDRQAESVTIYQHDPLDSTSLGNDKVYAIYQDQDGRLWVGTDSGLDIFDPDTEVFVHERRISGNRVTAITADHGANLWIAGYFGLFRTSPSREGYVRYEHRPEDPSSLSNDVVWALYEDREVMLWVGTLGGGISLWDGSNFTNYTPQPDNPHSLSHEMVMSFYEDAQGTVWIGTWGGGLNRFDRSTGAFSHYTEEDGLAGDVVVCVLGDDDGYLWLGTDRGLSRFDPRTETFRNFDERDGMQSGALLSCAQNDRGEMFFGGNRGLNAFHPGQFRDNPHLPPTVITAFKKFNQTERTDLPANERLDLSYRDSFISFEFAALDYTAPERNQYAYIMEGLDEDWVYAGTRRYAEYRNLRPGDYVFRVKGSNNDGVWNDEGVALSITVTPPFWERWWFRGAVLLALAGTVFGGFRLRVRGIEARSRELAREVEERTREIEQRRQVAEGLREVVAVLNSDRPLDETLDYIVAQASRLVGSEAAVLHRIEQDRQFVTIEASYGLPDELQTLDGYALHASRADQAILSRQPFVASDIQEVQTPGVEQVQMDSQAQRWLAVTGQHHRSLLAVPLIVEDEVYGCIAFYYAEPQAFSDEEIALAMALADQAALAIENARLRTQAEEAAVVAERNRLARDMHDSVTQSLFSLTLLAEAGERMIQARDMEQIEDNQALLSEIARRALQEMRLMVYELRPRALKELGLRGAVEQRLEAVERRAGMDARLVVEGEWDLPPDVEEELYGITQEALNNALKHANASSVTVTIRAQDRTVALEVQDDGHGFNPQAITGRGGLGLVSMRERAEKIGGTLTIRSTPGEGTRVQVVEVY
jgi:signal transduction histidine kinase/ligand-binding sensor domain-containing protein